MKKILLPILMLLAIVGTSKAQTNALSVADITLPQNSDATLTVSFLLDAEGAYTGYSFNLELPSDLEFVMAEGTDVAFAKGSCHDASHSVTANLSEGLVKVAGLSLSSKPLVGTSGVLLTFTVKPKSAVTVGQTFQGTIKDILFVPIEGDKKNLTASNFTITIGEPVDFRTILDENSTTVPTAATGVDVRVKRTINAGNWSTICLPFAMSETQVKAAFGNDVALGDFKGWEAEYDAADAVVGIKVNFEQQTEIEANHPYIIKTSSSYTDFTVDDVTIDPEDDPAISVGKKNKGTLGSFTGSYVPVVIDEECLFLNANKFWYSKGETQMKGYRAYFYFQEILAVYEATSAARVKMSITDGDGNTTNIDPRTMQTIESGKVYNMNGQYVGEAEDANSLPKGIYIVNGKKKVIK